MQVTAAQVKELREKTGAGMMECKKALEITEGNIDLAIIELRKSGKAKADKKSGRIAADGMILLRSSPDQKQCFMVEINSETDFVARDENFIAFANAVADIGLAIKAANVDVLSQAILPTTGSTIEEARQALVAKVGENIHLRRALFKESATALGTYLHGSRIGVIVALDTDHAELAKDIAMHVAAAKPLVSHPEEVPEEIIAKEKEIYLAQASGSGKPQDVMDKMVAGRIKKYLDEVSLMSQPFIRDPSLTVANLVNKHRAKILNFTRYEVGEGIEKETENFVDAVMSQVHGG